MVEVHGLVEQPDNCGLCGNPHESLEYRQISGSPLQKWVCEWCELVDGDSLKVIMSRMFQKLAGVAESREDEELRDRALTLLAEKTEIPPEALAVRERLARRYRPTVRGSQLTGFFVDELPQYIDPPDDVKPTGTDTAEVVTSPADVPPPVDPFSSGYEAPTGRPPKVRPRPHGDPFDTEAVRDAVGELPSEKDLTGMTREEFSSVTDEPVTEYDPGL